MNGIPLMAQDAFVAAPIPRVRREPAQMTPLVWLMGLYVFFFPIQFEAATINLAPSDIFLGAALLFCVYRLRLMASVWSPVHVGLVGIFLMAAGLSLAAHGSLSTYVIVKLVGLFTLLASYLCLTTAANHWKDIRLLMRIYIVATSLHCVFAVVAFEVGYNAPWLNYGHVRVSGMLIDPNAFGGLVLVALLMQLGSYMGGRVVIPGYLGVAATAALTAGLALTLSRSAWIGFTFGFLLISFLRPRVWIIATFLAVGLAGGAYLWVASHESKGNEVLLARENTAMERVEQIRQAIPMISSHPILGVGLGEFDELSDPAGYHPMVIHNTTVWILTEFGLVGLSVYIAFIIWFFRRGWVALRLGDREWTPLVVGLLGAHAGMLGLSTGIEALYQRHWWLVMALLATSAVAASRDLAHRRGSGI